MLKESCLQCGLSIVAVDGQITVPFMCPRCKSVFVPAPEEDWKPLDQRYAEAVDPTQIARLKG